MEKQFSYVWRNKFLTLDAESIDDMIAGLEGAADYLQQMKDAGVVLDPNSDIGHDFAMLVTSDPSVAERFDFDPDEEEEEEED